MKNSVYIIATLLLLVSVEVCAQRSSVSLYSTLSKHNVSYKSGPAIVSFYNKDVIERFENERTEDWFVKRPDDDKKKFEMAIAWLKKGHSITLSEQATSEKYAAELKRLIRGVIGGDLMAQGKAHVVNSTNQVQTSVYYEESWLVDKKTYNFFFSQRGTQPFFTGQSYDIVENVEGAGEVIFEAPVETIVTEDDPDEIFMSVEEMPTYPGGKPKLEEYITKKLKYPKSARDNGIEGTVFVGFVVEKDGTLTDIMVIRGLEKDCDKEAIRLIETSGKWIPGKQGGKLTRVKYVVPVKFKLETKK